MAVGWSTAQAHGFGRFAGEPGRRPQGRTRFPEGTALYTPPGWPEGVRPPHSEEWEDTAAAFLLDCCPAEYRGYAVLRRHPIVLARFAAEHVASQVQACRDGIGGVRASLGPYVTPEVLDAALAAWHEQAELLRRRRREVALVEEALRGGVFVPKL